MIPINKQKILSFKNEAEVILRGNRFPFPRMVSCWLTTICNYNCSFCLFKKENKEQHKIAPTAWFLKFIDEMVYCGVRSLEFSGGGEPTLHPDFKEIIKYAYKKGLKLGLFTNGYKFDEKLAKYFRYIRFSMDAHNKEVYNAIKNPNVPNAFDKVCAKIRRLVKARGKKNRPRIGLKFVLNDWNCIFDKDMVDLGRKLNVDYVQFKGEHNGYTGFDKVQANLVQLSINYLKKKYPDFISGSVIPTVLKTKCFMSPIHTVVDPEGNAYVCCYLNDKEHTIGNVFKNKLSEIWGLTKHRKICHNLKIRQCAKYDCRFAGYSNYMKEVIKDDVLDIDFI